MRDKEENEKTSPDPVILALETATPRASIALGTIQSHIEIEAAAGKYLDALMVRIQDLMAEKRVGFRDLDAVAVSMGPGNFTGVKVGVATAKTLAVCLGIPIFGVSTLEVLAFGSRCLGTVCPLVDARRGEIFWAAFQRPEGQITRIRPDALSDPESLIRELMDLPGPVRICGEPAGSIKELWAEAEFSPDDDLFPRADSLLAIAAGRFALRSWDSPVALVPNYIRGAVHRGGGR